jgi:thiol-disulfide isomerase/thioredoxin
MRTALTIFVLACIAGGIIYLETRGAGAPTRVSTGSDLALASADARVAEKATRYEPGKDISTPDAFINAEPFSIQELVGQNVVLVDFWTYSCVNCQRTLPYLNAWHERYADDGLVIIGVHTPEFEFEQDLANVQRAVDKWGIEYPVVLDNDYSTWSAYKNRYWPRKYLIDIDGFVVYDHIGEGAYAETERKIVELLNERKRLLNETGVVALKDGAPADADAVNFDMVKTPETYLGSSRIEYLVNLPARSCLSGACSYSYSDSDETPLNRFELSGTWRLDEEYARLEALPGSIRLRFSANKVNLVAGAMEKDVRADIYLDGAKLDTLTFSTHDLYTLVDLQGAYGEHVLEIRFLDAGIAAFAFTFG